MTNDEARTILLLYRPGTADRNDPSFTEALERTKPYPPPGRWQDTPDPELGLWFQKHCSSHVSIRSKFLKISVPPALKDQILSECKMHTASIIPFQPMDVLRIAAVVVLCLSLAAWHWRSLGRENDFNIYRSRMARTAMQPYSMDLPSHNLQFINAFLAEHKAPADYVLPDGVLKAQPVGCAILRWQGQPVSMICFHSGQPLPAGEKSDLWLFVIDQASVRNGPAARSPIVTRVVKLMTATWIRDGKMYVLATDGDEEFLRKYL